MNQNEFIRNISFLVALTVIFSVLGLAPGISPEITGLAGSEINQYKASLGGIGSTAVKFEKFKALEK